MPLIQRTSNNKYRRKVFSVKIIAVISKEWKKLKEWMKLKYVYNADFIDTMSIKMN
jgi:hypothetical protein